MHKNLCTHKNVKNCPIIGVLMGITNMAATIPGFLVPTVVGALTHGKVNMFSDTLELSIS